MSRPVRGASIVGMPKRTLSMLGRPAAVLAAGALTMSGLAAPAAAAPMPPYSAAHDLTATEVTFTGSGTALNGTIVRRGDLDPAVPRPGIVLVHGSGPGRRGTLGQEAEVFARAGIVTLIYDKRSDYSKLNRDFGALADDAIAAVRTLRATAGVDPAKVGVWGLSEGGWIAPLAAARTADIAFLITVGAPGLPPLRTQAWNLANRLSAAGVAPATVRAIAGTGMRIAAGTGLFPGADHDPVRVLAGVTQPVLAMWGELDVQVPPRESAGIFRDHLTASRSVTIRILPRGHHAARVTTDGYDRVGGPDVGGYRFVDLLPGYGTLMTSWLSSITAGRPPASSIDALPAQRFDSWPVAPLTGLRFGLFALLLAALASWPGAAVVRRWRGRRGAPVAAVPARWLAATGLGAALGVAGYVCWAVANQAKGISGTAAGQPLPWLGLRILLIGALASTAVLGVTWWRHRSVVTGGHRVRLAILAAGGVSLIPVGLAFGLLQP